MKIRICLLLILSLGSLAYADDDCGLLLQAKTVTGVGLLDYIEAQPELKARILAHPNGPGYLENLNTDPSREHIPTAEQLERRLDKNELYAAKGYAGSLSRPINAYCCGPQGILHRLRNWKTAAHREHLIRGLAKLDRYEGAVFRDFHVADEAELAPYLRESEVIPLKRFWSSSRLRTRQYGGDTPRRRLDLTLVIRSRTGRSIERIGWIFIDYEVLFAPGARFRVDMVFPRVGGSHLVFLSEV